MKRRNRKNRKYGKTLPELRQHDTVKVATFKPLAGGWYRCYETGKGVRRNQILPHLMEIVHDQRKTIIKHG